MDWVKGDLAAWQFLNQIRQGDVQPHLGEAADKPKQFQKDIALAFQRMKDEGISTENQAAADRVVDLYRRTNLFPSSAPRGKFVLELLAKDTVLAAAFAFFTKAFLIRGGTTVPQQVLEGALRAAAFSQGWAPLDSVEAVLSDLESKRYQADQALVHHETEAIRLVEESRKIVEGGHERVAAFVSDSDRIRNEQAAAWEKHVENATARVSALEAELAARIGLRAPGMYWSWKRKHHSWFANMYLCILVVYMIAAVYGITIAGPRFLSVPPPMMGTVPIWHFAAFATLLAVGIWGARIIVRLMLSNVHLSQDAHERTVIANSYLALMRTGKMPEKSFEHMLSALLRHSEDGIVKDDAMPYAELLDRLSRR